jgi:hypothetical protein
MAPQFSQELRDAVALENEKVTGMLRVVTLFDQQWLSDFLSRPTAGGTSAVVRAEGE